MKKLVNKLYNHQGGQLLISVFMATLCFAVLYLTHDIYWYSADDNEAMKVISGYMTGTASFSTPFTNAFIGYFLSLLYNITSAVSWYTIFHIAIIIFAVIVIFLTIIRILSSKRVHIILPAILCFALFFTVFSFMSLYLVFTATATIIGCAAVSFLILANFSSNRIIKFLDYFFSAVCLILSFMLRYQCGLVSACFWGLTLLYFTVNAFIKDKKIVIKKIVKIISYALVVCVVAYMFVTLSTNIKTNNEPDGYFDYSSYRSRYLDYNSASWYTSEDFYKNLGWDEDFYNLTRGWFFMDSRFNLENLKAINDETLSNGYELSIKEKIFSSYESMIKNPVGLAFTLTIIILFVFIFVTFLLNKERKKDILLLLFSLGTLSGFFILTMYLIINGRFLFHIYQTVALPTITILSIISAIIYKKGCFIKSSKAKHLILYRSISVILILSILLPLFLSLSTTYSSELIDSYKKRSAFADSLEEYALQNPQNLYIHNNCNVDVRAFLNDINEYGNNTITWGSCIHRTKAYYDFLDKFGYDDFYSENFYDENVYIVIEHSNVYDDIIQSFNKYMNYNYGQTEMVIIYQNEYFTVFDINKC